MSQIASKGQLYMALLRWILFLVPLIMFLGYLSGKIAVSGDENRWYQLLIKPSIQPPGWVFGVTWSLLYAMMATALALVINARGAQGRGMAIALFCAQFTLNLLWSSVFFAWHQVSMAFWLLIVIFILVAFTTVAFMRIRKLAGLLMLPYICWLGFAGWLTYEIDRLNPNAAKLAVPAAATHIDIE